MVCKNQGCETCTLCQLILKMLLKGLHLKDDAKTLCYIQTEEEPDKREQLLFT